MYSSLREQRIRVRVGVLIVVFTRGLRRRTLLLHQAPESLRRATRTIPRAHAYRSRASWASTGRGRKRTVPPTRVVRPTARAWTESVPASRDILRDLPSR